MGLLFCIKPADMFYFPIGANGRFPPPPNTWPMSTDQCPAILASSSGAFVLTVNNWSHITDIAHPVIWWVSVDMVNEICWPWAVYIKPCKPMSPNARTINFDFDVTIWPFVTSLIPSFYRPSKRFLPSEDSRVLVIVENYFLVYFFALTKNLEFGYQNARNDKHRWYSTHR